MKHRPEPEALAVNGGGKWTITATPAGTPAGARADHTTRTLYAPLGATPRERAARQLALVRAAIEPTNPTPVAEMVAEMLGSRYPIGPNTIADTIAAAHTWRTHAYTALHALGDVSQLDDPAARRAVDDALAAAEHDPEAMNAALLMWARSQHTADARSIAAAIGKTRPELRAKMTRARRRIAAIMAAAEDGDPTNHARRFHDGTTSWHTTYTIPRIAEEIAALLAEATPQQGTDYEPADDGTDTAAAAMWHPVRLARPELRTPQTGTLARSHRRRVDHGRIIAAPTRLYTDPMRRAFYRKTRGYGATVVLDISGSMSLDADDVADILNAAPGATIYAYRNRHNNEPNLYRLAADGRAADPENIPTPGGSNGLDGPALRIAARGHRAGEPFIWITDGAYNGTQRGAPDKLLAADILAALADVPEATYYETIPAAVTALERIARGGHPDPATLPWQVTTFTNHPTDRKTTP